MEFVHQLMNGLPTIKVSSMCVDHFVCLYHNKSSNEAITSGLLGLESRITSDMSHSLDEPYTSVKGRVALFSMYPWKASGPDGFTSDFFKKIGSCWVIMLPELFEYS